MSAFILQGEERISVELRSLYKQYGYLPYKMSKFEEYDLYVANKEFLAGDGVIPFNDTNGKLMALKPDVTLSILKNDGDGNGKRKVYYDENVYRISAKTKQFKEIRQVGLECIGDIDVYDVYETVCLAASSLANISESFALDVSHLGILSAVLKELACGEAFTRQVMRHIGEKNAHETARLCEEYGVSEANKAKLITLVSAYGNMPTVLTKIAPLCVCGEAKAAYESLVTLCDLLQNTPYADKIRLDFSVVNDMNYYDDIVFKGFVEGVGEGVLSGGRYDRLLARMGRKSGAIGFAVYLAALEGFGEEKSGTDVDVLVLYDHRTELKTLLAKVDSLIRAGKSVRVQKQEGGARFGETVDLRGGKEC